MDNVVFIQFAPFLKRGFLFSLTQEGTQTPISQHFHICHIHLKGDNHILSGTSDTLADLFRHICLKLLSEKDVRN